MSSTMRDRKRQRRLRELDTSPSLEEQHLIILDMEARTEGPKLKKKYGFFDQWDLVTWKHPDTYPADKYSEAGFEGPFLIRLEQKVCINGSKEKNHQFLFLEDLEGNKVTLKNRDEDQRFGHGWFVKY
jgi:hypothetical protein